MKLKAILTGATGMVGEGVLHECLQHDEVEGALVVVNAATKGTEKQILEVKDIVALSKR